MYVDSRHLFIFSNLYLCYFLPSHKNKQATSTLTLSVLPENHKELSVSLKNYWKYFRYALSNLRIPITIVKVKIFIFIFFK